MVRSAVALERSAAVRVVQVPKSIDNDLWLPLPLATLATKPLVMPASAS
jgi:6-phosphofructokinase